MKGDEQTESEQTKSDEAAYKASPTDAKEMHETSSKERTKRTLIRSVFLSACCFGTLITAASVAKSLKLPNNNPKMLKK